MASRDPSRGAGAGMGASLPGGLQPIQDLEPKFARENAGRALAAWEALPLKLPAGGSYEVKVEGSTLHISETSGGITSYQFTDPAKGGGVQMQPGAVVLEVTGIPGIRAVALQAAPAAADPRALPSKMIPALPLIEELERLSRKKYDDVNDPQAAQDKLAMADLVRRIQAEIAKPKPVKADPAKEADKPGARKSAPRPKPAPAASRPPSPPRSTPSSWSPPVTTYSRSGG